MRWLACCLLLVGCLRARATAIYPSEHERSSGGPAVGGSIARTDPANAITQPANDPSAANLVSFEVGALFPFQTSDSTRVHIAPGARIFGSQLDALLFGVAVGAELVRPGRPGFTIEGSLHAGNINSDPKTIDQALDVFAGVTLQSKRSSVAVGPSVGILASPGGQSVVMFGLGVRLTNSSR